MDIVRFDKWLERYKANSDHLPEKKGLLHDLLPDVRDINMGLSKMEFASRLEFLLWLADIRCEEHPDIRKMAYTRIAQGFLDREKESDIYSPGPAGGEFNRSVSAMLIQNPTLMSAFVGFYRLNPAETEFLNLLNPAICRTNQALYDTFMRGFKKLAWLLTSQPKIGYEGSGYRGYEGELMSQLAELRMMHMASIVEIAFHIRPVLLLRLAFGDNQEKVISIVHRLISSSRWAKGETATEWVSHNEFARIPGYSENLFPPEVYLILLARTGLLKYSRRLIRDSV